MNTIPLFAQDDNPTRKCTGPCARILPATPEYFYAAKTGKYGLQSKCKECRSNQAKEYGTRPEVQEHRKAYHSSPEVKSHRHEYLSRPEVRENERVRDQAYRSRPYVRESKRIQDQNYRNRPGIHEQLLIKKRNYHSRPDIRERRHIKDSQPEARQHRKVYRSQPEVWEYERAYERKYHSRPEVQEHYQSHRHGYNRRPDVIEHRRIYHSQPYTRAIYSAHARNRYALEKNASGTHNAKQIREQYQRQKGTCYYCFHRVTWGKHHVDHVVPLTRGGSNDISNLVIACAPCNLHKNNKMPHEWHKGGRLL